MINNEEKKGTIVKLKLKTKERDIKTK